MKKPSSCLPIHPIMEEMCPSSSTCLWKAADIMVVISEVSGTQGSPFHCSSCPPPTLHARGPTGHTLDPEFGGPRVHKVFARLSCSFLSGVSTWGCPYKSRTCGTHLHGSRWAQSVLESTPLPHPAGLLFCLVSLLGEHTQTLNTHSFL